MNNILNKLPRDHHFDYQFLLSLLSDYKAPRDKIGLMIRNNEIIRVKKGLYILSPEWGGRCDPVILANVVYGPSYVSLESALAYWGLIPEAVTAVTSMSTGRSKRFSTPVGEFIYRHIQPSAYVNGIVRRQIDTVPFLIASPEKALCDRTALAVTIRTIREIGPFLHEDLRIDETRLAEFDRDLFDTIARDYGSPAVRMLAAWFGKYMGGRKA